MLASQLVASGCYAVAAWWLLRGRIRAPLPEHPDEAAARTAGLSLPDGASLEPVTARLLEEPLIAGDDPEAQRSAKVAGVASVNESVAHVDAQDDVPGSIKDRPAAEWLDAPWADTWTFCGEARHWQAFLGQVCRACSGAQRPRLRSSPDPAPCLQAGGSCLSVALELWQLQIVSFLAATLGPVDIATHNCLITLFELISTVSPQRAGRVREPLASGVLSTAPPRPRSTPAPLRHGRGALRARRLPPRPPQHRRSEARLRHSLRSRDGHLPPPLDRDDGGAQLRRTHLLG